MAPEQPLRQGESQGPRDEVHAQGDAEHLEGRRHHEGEVDVSRASRASPMEGEEGQKYPKEGHPDHHRGPIAEVPMAHDKPSRGWRCKALRPLRRGAAGREPPRGLEGRATPSCYPSHALHGRSDRSSPTNPPPKSANYILFNDIFKVDY